METRRDYGSIAADVRLAQQNDAEAMNRILTDVQDMVYYNCLRMLKDEHAAQDAAQDILITVYRKIGTLSDPASYIGWVKRITANHCKNCLCKVNKEFLLSETEDGEDPFASFEDTDEQKIPDKALDNEETRRMIVDLVDKLPDEQRMCVMLYYYDELKTREIAETLGISENTVKSRLNYARKAIKEGVKAYEKQGVKLYGASPIPFLGYFLGKSAAVTAAPVVAAEIAAAAGTAAAAGAAAAAGSAAATTGIGAFLATTAGKIVAGVVIAAVLGGVGTGATIAVLKTQKAEKAVVQMSAAPSEEPIVQTGEQTPEETPKPTVEPTEEPTPEPTEEPTPESETPEEALKRLTGFSEEETGYLLDRMSTILREGNLLGRSYTGSIAEIWEIHSLDAYRAYRQTDAWKDDVPESEIACYGVRLEDGTVFYLYLGDGLPVDGTVKHEWEIYRIYLPETGEYLYKEDYLEGPQWTDWSEEEPPEDALEVETKTEYRGRWCYAYGSYWEYRAADRAEFESRWRADYEEDCACFAQDGYTIHTYREISFHNGWDYCGESDTMKEDIITYDVQVHFRHEWNEETGKWKVWCMTEGIGVSGAHYTPWSDWYPSESEIPPIQVGFEYTFRTDPQWQTQDRILYRCRKR